MTTLLPMLFKEELLSIQQRHSIVFPVIQLKNIKLRNDHDRYELQFLEGYDLSSEITMEIELAFRFVFDKKPISGR